MRRPRPSRATDLPGRTFLHADRDGAHVSAALPTDVTAVVRSLVESSGWSFELSDAAGALRRLFELGVRWEEAPSKAVGEVRRSLLRTRDHVFKELVQILATADYCSAEIRRELARTPAF